MTLEFRRYHPWPFILNGREVNIGDFLYVKNYRKVCEVKEMRLIYSERDGTPIPEVLINTYQGGWHSDISDYDEWIVLCSESFSWPDETPQKKTTYLWAVPMYKAGLKEKLCIRFKRMTKEEAEKHWLAEMVPGSEEEAE